MVDISHESFSIELKDWTGLKPTDHNFLEKQLVDYNLPGLNIEKTDSAEYRRQSSSEDIGFDYIITQEWTGYDDYYNLEISLFDMEDELLLFQRTLVLEKQASGLTLPAVYNIMMYRMKGVVRNFVPALISKVAIDFETISALPDVFGGIRPSALSPYKADLLIRLNDNTLKYDYLFIKRGTIIRYEYHLDYQYGVVVTEDIIIPMDAFTIGFDSSITVDIVFLSHKVDHVEESHEIRCSHNRFYSWTLEGLELLEDRFIMGSGYKLPHLHEAVEKHFYYYYYQPIIWIIQGMAPDEIKKALNPGDDTGLNIFLNLLFDFYEEHRLPEFLT